MLLLLGYGLLYRGTGSVGVVVITTLADLKLTSILHYHNLTNNLWLFVLCVNYYKGTIADIDNAPNLTMLAQQNRELSNVDYAWWSGGKYVEYLAPTEVDDEDRPTTAEVELSIDGQGQGQELGQGSVNHPESDTAKQRVKVPLPGLKQTYGGHGHLQSLLARKTNKPPGVEGGCWDRMFVVFTGTYHVKSAVLEDDFFPLILF